MLSYCGVSFMHQIIGGCKKAVVAFYWAALKTCIVHNKKISILWCEDQLCGAGTWVGGGSTYFHETLVEGQDEARVQANKVLLDMKVSSIKAELQKSAKVLKFTDGMFDLETSLFTSMLGDEGAKILLGKTKSFFSMEDGWRPGCRRSRRCSRILSALSSKSLRRTVCRACCWASSLA